MKKSKKNSSLLLIIIGVATIGFSIFSYQKDKEFSSVAVETKGEIYYVNEKVHVDKSDDDESGNTILDDDIEYDITLQISFFTPDSMEHSFTTHRTDDSGTYYEGQIVTVSYDPDEPDKARMGSYEDIEYPWVIIGAGCVFILGGIILMIFRKKINARTNA
jgi:hypothetical protein